MSKLEGTNQWSDTHRPNKLDAMIGQEKAVKRAKGMKKSGNIPHCLLVVGKTSSGKTTFVRNFEQFINDYPGDTDDLIEYNIAEDSGKDDIKEIIHTADYMPKHKFRVMFLDEAHAMTTHAAKALLKPLEEPHKGIVWVLATDQPSKLPSQILNRCMPINLEDYTRESMLAILKRVYKKEKLDWGDNYKKILKTIVDVSGFQPRMAIQLMQGVASEIEGGEKVSKATIAAVAETLPAWALDKVAAKIILCCYVGSLTSLLQTLGDTSDYVGLVNVGLELHRYLLDMEGNAKTYHSFPRKNLRELLKNHSKLTYPSTAEILALHSTLTRIKMMMASYSVGEYHLLATELGKFVTDKRKNK